MMIHKLSSVAIVDENGKLVETLSSTDFLVVANTSLKELQKPVLQFLSEEYSVSIKPISIARNAEFKDVLESFREHGVHRIWIVDENTEKPIGVISMSDVLACLVPEGLQIEE
jgi:CBS domain-containing protein